MQKVYRKRNFAALPLSKTGASDRHLWWLPLVHLLCLRLLRVCLVVNADALFYACNALKHKTNQAQNNVKENKIHRMNRPALLLILVSQLLFLVSSLIEPPSSLLMIILRVGVPLIIAAYIGLLLAGYISPRKR